MIFFSVLTSKTNLHSDILVCPTEQFGEDGGSAHWIHKTQDRLLWVRSSFISQLQSILGSEHTSTWSLRQRGRTTGGLFNTRTPWRSSHRARLARLGDRNSTRSLDVLLPPDQDEALQDSEDLLGETIVKVGLADPASLELESNEAKSLFHLPARSGRAE